MHVYLLTSQAALPLYFVVYATVLIVCFLLAAGGIAIGRNPLVAQAGWYFGSLLSVVVLVVDLGTRAAGLPGLVAVTGRWDFAPATFSPAFAGGFVALHASVLLGINVAYPRHQHWQD